MTIACTSRVTSATRRVRVVRSVVAYSLEVVVPACVLPREHHADGRAVVDVHLQAELVSDRLVLRKVDHPLHTHLVSEVLDVRVVGGAVEAWHLAFPHLALRLGGHGLLRGELLELTGRVALDDVRVEEGLG